MTIAHPHVMAAIRSMLVPIDGSPPSAAALMHAVVLAERCNSKVDVLHVEGPDEFEVGSTSPIASGARAEFDHAMTDALEHARNELGDRVSSKTLRGDPLRVIIEYAVAGQYDLIVIGTHGRVGRLRSLLGSVAEGVVRNASCPVLTVREVGGGYQSFAERIHGIPSLAEQTELRQLHKV